MPAGDPSTASSSTPSQLDSGTGLLPSATEARASGGLREGPKKRHRPDYLTEQTAGSVIRNVFRIFLGHYWALFLLYVVPVLPFWVLLSHGQHLGRAWLAAAGVVGLGLVSVPAWAALMVGIGHICAGKKINVARAFKRGFVRRSPRVAGTMLWILVPAAAWFLAIQLASRASTGGGRLAPILAVALIALTILTLILVSIFLLAGPVAVLEPRWGLQALNRSRLLGKGYYFRNLGVVLLCFVVAFVPHWIITVVVSASIRDLVADSEIRDLAFAALTYAFSPIYGIAGVLLYYDMRVRKEFYNATILVTELGDPLASP